MTPRQPTADECSKKVAFEHEGQPAFYTWYPQILGGYVGMCAVVKAPSSSSAEERQYCFEVYVWHSGDFPFDGEDGEQPILLHHCRASQFIEFGNEVIEKFGKEDIDE